MPRWRKGGDVTDSVYLLSKPAQCSGRRTVPLGAPFSHTLARFIMRAFVHGERVGAVLRLHDVQVFRL